ncbi:MAG: LAGLIDADG family homing endonuclease [Candidatus Liptonbacteria bacterium]|nr:LAGLIDADG family homing endonuclease [Candidatus Liptonbacteria bacterium]
MLLNQENKKLSYEYIRGLIEGEGCFTFSSRKGNNGHKYKVPAFSLSMHERDQELLFLIKGTLNLKNKIYNYKNDGYKRGRKAILIVREFGNLKNVIIPLFYNKLHGHKKQQFLCWLEKIGQDPAVPESYKLLYRLHKCGFYNRHSKFD